ncbi:MAG: hypothetical protein WCQ50_07770 [Spirochaetota bacterium]
MTFKFLLLGTVRPLLLMIIATLLDSVWKLYHTTLFLNSVLVVCAIVIIGSIVRYAYLPWVLSDREHRAARVFSSAFVVLVILVQVSGFSYVALALGIPGIILAIKGSKENPRTRASNAMDAGDPHAAGKPAIDPFEVLGISPDATDEEIKAA